MSCGLVGFSGIKHHDYKDYFKKSLGIILIVINYEMIDLI